MSSVTLVELAVRSLSDERTKLLCEVTFVLLWAIWRGGGWDRVKHTAVLPGVVWITDTLHLVTARLQDTEDEHSQKLYKWDKVLKSKFETKEAPRWDRWRLWTHPVVGADTQGWGSRAGAEVEGGNGEAATLQTHHVRPTWCPIFHIAQIQAIIQHCVTTPVGQTVMSNHAYLI